jgi:DNA-binding winged helix-turn-helix (wHTH) protein
MQNTAQLSANAGYSPVTVRASVSDIAPKKTTCPCCGTSIDAKIPIVDLDTNTISWRGKSVKVSAQKAELMYGLVRAYPGVLRRDAAIIALWGGCEKSDPMSHLSVLTCHLRKALEPIGLSVSAVYGIGHQLVIGE